MNESKEVIKTAAERADGFAATARMFAKLAEKAAASKFETIARIAAQSAEEFAVAAERARLHSKNVLGAIESEEFEDPNRIGERAWAYADLARISARKATEAAEAAASIVDSK